MTIAQLKELARHSVKRTSPTEYTVESVDKAFASGIDELANTYNQFMKNRYDIYEILIETADEFVPNKVIQAVGQFAEVKTTANGQKALFTQKIGKNRARKFLTQVGINGVYETFRIDTKTFEVSGHAVGGGVTIDLQRMIDGAENLAELMSILTEGLVESVYVEVQKALVAAYSASGVPTLNRYSGNAFTASEMVKLITTVRAYGSGVIIYAPPEFVAAMGVDVVVAPDATYNNGAAYHPQDIDSIHNTGYISIFRGVPIVQIPQSFVDETNTKTWINPQCAYILPTGGEKVVKVVLEGPTIIRDYENRDGSMEIFAERKIGVAITTYHNWAMYKNTGIIDTSLNPYGI